MASVSIDADSDNEDNRITSFDDIDDLDYELPSAPAAKSRTTAAASTGSSGSATRPGQQQASSSSSSSFGGSSGGLQQPRVISTAESAKFKHYQVVYPIYIDVRRPHKNGERRVAKSKAIAYPKAQEIAQVAGQFFGLSPVFEPEKCHPRDWENPGRVRILIRSKETGKPINPAVPDKYTLLTKLCEGIRLLRKSAGAALPPSTSVLSRLPYYSPAISYGTYEEALKGGGKMNEMMRSMLGGGAGPGGAGAGRLTAEQEEEQKRKLEEKELAEKQRIARLKALSKQGRRMVRR